jgi:hypothetical protein
MFDAIPFQLLNRKLAERKTRPVNNMYVAAFTLRVPRVYCSPGSSHRGPPGPTPIHVQLDVQDADNFLVAHLLMVSCLCRNLSSNDRLFAAFVGFTRIQIFTKLLHVSAKMSPCVPLRCPFADPAIGNGGWNNVPQTLPFIRTQLGFVYAHKNPPFTAFVRLKKSQRRSLERGHP